MVGIQIRFDTKHQDQERDVVHVLDGDCQPFRYLQTGREVPVSISKQIISLDLDLFFPQKQPAELPRSAHLLTYQMLNMLPPLKGNAKSQVTAGKFLHVNA